MTVSKVEEKLKDEIRRDQQSFESADNDAKDAFKNIIVDINDRLITRCKIDVHQIYSSERDYPNFPFQDRVTPFLYLGRKAEAVHETFIYILCGSRGKGFRTVSELEKSEDIEYFSARNYLGPDWRLYCTKQYRTRKKSNGWSMEGLLDSMGVERQRDDAGHPLYAEPLLRTLRETYYKETFNFRFGQKREEELRKISLGLAKDDFKTLGEKLIAFDSSVTPHKSRDLVREYLCLMYWNTLRWLYIAKHISPTRKCFWPRIEDVKPSEFNIFAFNHLTENATNGTTDYRSFDRWYRRLGLLPLQDSPIRNSHSIFTLPDFLNS